MIFIKLFLIVVLSTIFLIFAFSTKLKIIQRLSIIFGYFILFFFILFPSYSDDVAHFFSIGTGKDLILYIAVSLISLISIILYVRVQGNIEMITKIVREDAKNRAKKCE